GAPATIFKGPRDSAEIPRHALLSRPWRFAVTITRVHFRRTCVPATVALTAMVLVAPARAAKFASPRQYKCVGPQITLTNSNTGAVQNGGTAPTLSTKRRAYCLIQISDYHWNDGQGATPGTVGLTVVAGAGGAGNTLGP